MADRGLSSGLNDALDEDTLRPALFVTAEFEDSTGTDETLRLWTGIGPISYGGETFTGSGTLLTLDGLEEVLDAISRGVTFTLSGIGTAEVNGNGDTIIDLAYRTEYQNRPITVDLVMFAGDEAQIGGFTLFRGVMDVMDPQEDAETATITLSAENALVALKRPSMRTYTHQDQQEIYPGDTFFSHVANLQNMEIKLN